MLDNDTGNENHLENEIDKMSKIIDEFIISERNYLEINQKQLKISLDDLYSLV